MSDRPVWASEHADEALHELREERRARFMPQASEPEEEDDENTDGDEDSDVDDSDTWDGDVEEEGE